MTDSKLINARAMLPLKIDPRSGNTQIFVSVIIKEARENFGRVDVRVTPLSGSGFAWVRLASLKRCSADEGRLTDPRTHITYKIHKEVG